MAGNLERAPAGPASPPPAVAAAQQTPQQQQQQQHHAWNHLQVPNYFPRQPQVAHMSSERSLSRSPLTWHTPTPPDHQQANVFRHTPTPPDLSCPKAASGGAIRHTATPPDRDAQKPYGRVPTPPDTQGMKAMPGSFFRHAPDMVHGVKNVPLYRYTPSPEGHKGVPSPLFNLQQMISDRGGQRVSDPMRDNPMVRGETIPFSRHSPNLAVGSMDLSVSRSPRNGSQNGELGLPMSLSVRDASKINSFDPNEISKLNQVPPVYAMKTTEAAKSSSPTLNLMSQRSNSPKSPKAAGKRPVKKVDSILERLNYGTDGVVITPVQGSKPSQSVIVSAHSADDATDKNSSTSEVSNSDRKVSAANARAFTENLPSSTTVSLLHCGANSTENTKEPALTDTRSVIRESSSNKSASPSAANFSNEDSNGSSSDSSKSRRRRKQLKTTKVENADTIDGHIEHPSSDPPEKRPPRGEDRLQTQISDIENKLNTDSNPGESIETCSDTSKQDKDDHDPVSVTKARRKTSSESETIDDIAAMIASSYSSDMDTKNSENTNLQSENELTEVLSKSPLSSIDVTKMNSPKVGADSTTVDKLSDDVFEENSALQGSTASGEQSKSKQFKDGSFVEVENELEKMFAGIEEHKNGADNKSDIVNCSTSENVSDVKEDPEKPIVKRGRKKRSVRKSTDPGVASLLSSDDNSPKKTRKQTKRKSPEKIEFDNSPLTSKISSRKGNHKIHQITTKDAYDSGSNASSSKSRGPYIQIRGPRDSPLSVSVINTPVQEEDFDKPLQKIRSLKSKSNFTVDHSFKNKVKSKGLHSSTLSMKYDATTTDTSWICVFCKKGPHTGPAKMPDSAVRHTLTGKSQQMGDLFGPYIISTDCPDYLSVMDDPYDHLFKSEPAQTTAVHGKHHIKSKRSRPEPEPAVVERTAAVFPNEEMYYGMTDAGGNSYEVWLHEDCAVWAPGLYLVGAKIVGLDAAVWSCCTMRCDLCGSLGATVACIKHGCRRAMHVNCARAAAWSLSEDNFLVYCNEHGLPLP